jgi:hypothetical protein
MEMKSPRRSRINNQDWTKLQVQAKEDMQTEKQKMVEEDGRQPEEEHVEPQKYKIAKHQTHRTQTQLSAARFDLTWKT